jgi:hypothetical protein
VAPPVRVVGRRFGGPDVGSLPRFRRRGAPRPARAASMRMDGSDSEVDELARRHMAPKVPVVTTSARLRTSSGTDSAAMRTASSAVKTAAAPEAILALISSQDRLVSTNPSAGSLAPEGAARQQTGPALDAGWTTLPTARCVFMRMRSPRGIKAPWCPIRRPLSSLAPASSSRLCGGRLGLLRALRVARSVHALGEGDSGRWWPRAGRPWPPRPRASSAGPEGWRRARQELRGGLHRDGPWPPVGARGSTSRPPWPGKKRNEWLEPYLYRAFEEAGAPPWTLIPAAWGHPLLGRHLGRKRKREGRRSLDPRGQRGASRRQGRPFV